MKVLKKCVGQLPLPLPAVAKILIIAGNPGSTQGHFGRIPDHTARLAVFLTILAALLPVKPDSILDRILAAFQTLRKGS